MCDYWLFVLGSVNFSGVDETVIVMYSNRLEKYGYYSFGSKRIAEF